MAVEGAVVIGAGPAGLAAAAMLQRAGVPVRVLDRAEAVGSSWRHRYDRLRLNTVSWISGLPGYPFPRRLGRWVARDDYVAYLEEYARRERLRVEFGTEVTRIDRDGDGWRLQTPAGSILAASVVVATGHDRVPFLPEWPGRDGFTGALVHAAEYRSPLPFLGARVLVVACGNSGADIATDLAEAGVPVQVSMRTPPNVFPREFLGVPLTISTLLLERLPAPVFDAVGRLLQRVLYGDLASSGMPPAPLGVQSTMLARGVSPVTDDGFVAALREGRIEIVPEVARFAGAEVLLADGRQIRPDALVVATGYRRGLEPLVGHLGVLDGDGGPAAHGEHSPPGAEGLHFIGFRPKLSGQLHDFKGQAKAIARAARKRFEGRAGLAPAGRRWQRQAAPGQQPSAPAAPRSGSLRR